ncbi:MAG: glycosyltransferase family 2 protein [Lachnospiraceae bacterium]
MKQNKLITIIVPVYNIIEYLPRCVHSICSQTYRNLEIILVDDGSTDGTDRLCDELGQEDARIKVIHQNNAGSSAARNTGIRAATGDYLGFVDSDDYVEPRMYELLIEAIDKYDCPVAQAARRELTESGEELPPICIPPETTLCYSPTDFLKELLLHKGDCSFCTKLIDAVLFQHRLFPEGVLNEDFNLLVHLLQDIEGIVSIPQQMYNVCYRIGSNTRKLSKGDFSRVYGDCVDNADMVETLVNARYPELHRYAVRFALFQRMEYLLHIPIAQMTADHVQYCGMISYLRSHIKDTISNPYLTKRNKIYILLFTMNPLVVRQLHVKLRHPDNLSDNGEL